MATTTPNFGWSVPTSTDLVKDGATAIETLGDSIDASLVDLKGGTSGQILAKNSNTDMDFVWVANDQGDITEVTAGTGISGGGTSGAVTITNAMATAIDAKGDLIAGTGADAFSRLAIGTNGQVLTADSAETTGMKWATSSSGGGMTQISSTVLTGATTTLSSIPTTYKNLQLVLRDFASSANADVFITFNNNTSTIYYQNGFSTNDTTNSLVTALDSKWQPVWQNMNSGTGDTNSCVINIFDYANTACGKTIQSTALIRRAAQSYKVNTFGSGVFFSTTAITSIEIKVSTGNWSGGVGTAILYGVN